ncbi:hypothetical protein [Gramella sp. Hel_I_59]|uniref:hypothetical protein n=1 Tax=Gramella sp. Hel_I_59 TaxID=1249978 RepID=UPI001153F2EF|nr:hypothetical protein [Gramella sp. Hel_I_59]
MKKEDKLLRLSFLISLLILLINDFYLKYEFHNEFTGKLSDFAGLFAFPYFIATVFEKRIRAIYILTAFLFIWWKTPYSQQVIDILNDHGMLVNRVIDYSDLIALFIIPVSYRFWKSKSNFKLSSKRIFRPIVITICCFSFLATTIQQKSEEYNLKSDYKLNTQIKYEDAVKKLRIIRNDSIEALYYWIQFPERDGNIMTRIDLMKNDEGNLNIKLDSILDFSIPNTGGFFGMKYDKENAKYFRKLSQNEIEDFFHRQIKEELER